MKISKLFHWLYALLMLLPAFFVGGRMAYTIFNKNAKDSYSGANGYSIQYKYATNEVNSINDIQVGHLYTLTINSQPSVTSTQKILLAQGVFNMDNYSERFNMDATSLSSTLLSIRIATNTISINDNYTSSSLFQVSYVNITFPYSFDFIFYSFDTNYTNLTEYPISESTYNEIADVDISNLGTLDNAFDYSMSQLNELPLFSWAKDSFIVQPFTYITGLFGMPSDSPVLTLLSYWCSISLIWLTFDLLMYVPLLVHRWLDKGVLE